MPSLRRLPPLLLLSLALVACKREAPADAAETPPAGASGQIAAAVDAVNPVTSPREAVIASMRKFMAVRSYHASMRFDGGARGTMINEVDFVAPDRFRMQMAGIGTQYVIGDTMYMSMQGRTMQVPMPKGTLTKWRDPGNFGEAEATMTVESLGNETLDGIATRKYLAHHSVPRPADVTLWIGPDDLPVQMQVSGESKGQSAATTVRYSRFDDPTLKVDPPK